MAAMERDLDTFELFRDPTFADVTVKFGKKELKLHKVILCTRSKYFERALRPGGQFAVCQS